MQEEAHYCVVMCAGMRCGARDESLDFQGIFFIKIPIPIPKKENPRNNNNELYIVSKSDVVSCHGCKNGTMS